MFRLWRHQPQVFYLAYQQAIAQGKEPTKATLEEECNYQDDFLEEAAVVPDLTQEEYRAYRSLRLPPTYELNTTFESADELLEACKAKKARPPLKAVAQLARGNDLVALVQQLEPLAAEVVQLDALKKELADLKQQRHDQGQPLTEKIRQLEKEIAKMEGEDEPEEEPEEPEDDDDSGDDEDADETGEDSHGETADVENEPSAFDVVEFSRQLEFAVTRLERAIQPDNLPQVKDKKTELMPLLARATTALDAVKLALATEEEDVKPVP